MIAEVKALYKKNRHQIPLCKRSLFQLPLQFRIKQGQQQLQLWIKWAQLIFVTYEDIHISNDQTNRITDWLSNWDLGESMIAHEATRSPVPAQRTRLDSFDSEMSNPRLGSEQTNISNWLKSWGHSFNSTTQHDKRVMTVSTQESKNNEYSDLK
jgi:hypothetical protein